MNTTQIPFPDTEALFGQETAYTDTMNGSSGTRRRVRNTKTVYMVEIWWKIDVGFALGAFEVCTVNVQANFLIQYGFIITPNLDIFIKRIQKV